MRELTVGGLETRDQIRAASAGWPAADLEVHVPRPTLPPAEGGSAAGLTPPGQWGSLQALGAKPPSPHPSIPSAGRGLRPEPSPGEALAGL